MFRLFFRHRSSQHRLTRRQHVRALMELSRLAETTPREQLLDPATPQGQRLVTIVDALRQRPHSVPDEAAPPMPHPEERPNGPRLEEWAPAVLLPTLRDAACGRSSG